VDTLIDKTVGRIRLVVGTDCSESPDLSWLGEFSDWRLPKNKEEKLVYLNFRYVMDHKGIWRDDKGRFVSFAPDHYRKNIMYLYSFHNNGHLRGSWAIADSKRLCKYGIDWCMLTISAKVSLNGVVISSERVSGWDSDIKEPEILSEARSIANFAIGRARTWLEDLYTGEPIGRRN